MRWRITAGPETVSSGGGDVYRWRWILENTEDQHRRPVLVDVSRSAMAARRVSRPTALAISSRGRTALELFLSWREPPDRIVFSTTDVPAVYGGDPPELSDDERLEFEDIVSFFAMHGYQLEVSPVEGGWSAVLIPHRSRTGSAPFERGITRLDAARRARERYAHELPAAAG